MLARLDLLLPFSITIPEGEHFSIYSYDDKGYTILIYPPMKSEHLTQEDSDDILINGKPAFRANALRIYFQKDNFDRRQKSECDPPYLFMAETINLFLSKLRFVTRGGKIRPINLILTTWHLRYLNDDESELDETEGLVRGRGSKTLSFSWITLNNDMWGKIFELPQDYIPPQWEMLLLDANEAMPEIGLSIVLAETALEVFISHILNELSKNSPIPKGLWDWINNRYWWLQEPTTDEQFDILLKTLLGVSLKENTDLWESFKKLKKARNSFVHEGIAKIKEKPISEAEARQLLGKANEIVKFIKDKLPDPLHWPEYKFLINVEVKKRIL